MKLKTLIIDDEPIALAKLHSYVEKVPFLELVAECQGAYDALEYLSSNDVDLIFTDIDMPDQNGLEFVESLSGRPMIVFVTAYAQYAVDSYRFSAVDYLLKPYSFTDFQRASNKALDSYRARHQTVSPTEESSESLFVKVETRFVRIDLSQIQYIKSYSEYLQIYLAGVARPLMPISSFAAIMDRLSDNFVQVHRSYVVNMNRIQHIERNRIIINAETYIPIGDSYKSVVKQYLLSHAVGKSTRLALKNSGLG